jgi:DNA repair photolyase
VYCYARPTHEWLGFSAGLDFETRILVKEKAPQLLRAALASHHWRPQVVAMSGVTVPYQPIEAILLTRVCLEVLVAFRNPVAIVTKNALVARVVICPAGAGPAPAVIISITTRLRSPRVVWNRAPPPPQNGSTIRALRRTIPWG